MIVGIQATFEEPKAAKKACRRLENALRGIEKLQLLASNNEKDRLAQAHSSDMLFARIALFGMLGAVLGALWDSFYKFFYSSVYYSNYYQGISILTGIVIGLMTAVIVWRLKDTRAAELLRSKMNKAQALVVLKVKKRNLKEAIKILKFYKAETIQFNQSAQ